MAEISVYGTDSCIDTIRTRRHLNQIEIPYRYINIDKDELAEQKVLEWNGGRRITPTVVVSSSHGGTSRLAEPDNDELDEVLRQHGVAVAA